MKLSGLQQVPKDRPIKIKQDQKFSEKDLGKAHCIQNKTEFQNNRFLQFFAKNTFLA